jgi:hypothetical protein
MGLIDMGICSGYSAGIRCIAFRSFDFWSLGVPVGFHLGCDMTGALPVGGYFNIVLSVPILVHRFIVRGEIVDSFSIWVSPGEFLLLLLGWVCHNALGCDVGSSMGRELESRIPFLRTRGESEYKMFRLSDSSAPNKQMGSEPFLIIKAAFGISSIPGLSRP